MPCLVEAETIAVCAEKARDPMECRNIAEEILIADHGKPAARGRRRIVGGSEHNNFRDLYVFIKKQNESCVLVTRSRFKGAIEPGAMAQNLP